MLDLKDIKCLVTVASVGTLNRAATILGTTQPALTRRIKKLEDRFQLKLFDRKSKGLEPTPAGSAFIKNCRPLLTHANDIEEEMLRYKLGRGDTVKVGIKPGFERPILENCLSQFIEKFPNTAVKISTDTTPGLMTQLKVGKIDFAIAAIGYVDDFHNELLHSDDLEYTPLITIPLSIVTHKNHPALSNENFFDILFQFPLVSPTPPIHIYEKLQAEYSAHNEVTAIPHIEIDDVGIAINLVSKAKYWTVLFQPSIPEVMRHGDFVTFTNDKLLPPLEIGFVRRKTWSPTPASNAFMNTLINEISLWGK